MQKILNNPLISFALKQKAFSFCFLGGVIFLNFLAAILEGLSFSLILLAFTALSKDSLPSLISPYFKEIPSGNLFSLFILGSIGLQALRSLLFYLGQTINIRFAASLQVKAQKAVFSQIFSFSYRKLTRYRAGDLVEYAQAPEQSILLVMEALNRGCVAFLMVSALLIMMFLCSLYLTLFALGLLLFFLCIQKVIIKKITKHSKGHTQKNVELSKKSLQILLSLRDITLFNRKKEALESVEKDLSEISSAIKGVHYWHQLVQPFNEVAGIIFVGIILVMGPFLLKDPILPKLLTFLPLTYRLSTRAQILIFSLRDIFFHYGPLKRLQEILSPPNKELLGEPLTLFPGLQRQIAFKDVSFGFHDEKQVLKKLSFTISKGEVVALVGTSGAGKTSILDLLLSLYCPSSGKIVIDDVNLLEYDAASLRESLGIVPQNPFIFNDTVFANIAFGKKEATEEEVKKAASLSFASNFIEKLPQGYQTLVGESGHTLSEGERQRLALARALVKDPEILILDEATSHLDSHAESFIQSTLAALKREKTIILVAHRLNTIADADKILVIDEGELKESGTHKTLLARNGIYASLWNLQNPLP